MAEPVIQVKDLVVSYGAVRAVHGVSLEAYPGETVAIVGESGCGKTTLAKAILGLTPITEGSITFGGPWSSGKSILAERIGMVWQDPFASFDPRWTIRRSIEEPGALAGKKVDVESLLASVGLTAELGSRHPHQLSGGQRQRAAMARALALHPPLLICDEPTAALDLSIQAQILNLLRDLQKANQCAVLYISHDLGTVRFLADRVLVMNKGVVVEHGKTAEIFGHPQHSYTQMLLGSALNLDELGRLPGGVEG